MSLYRANSLLASVHLVPAAPLTCHQQGHAPPLSSGPIRSLSLRYLHTDQS